MTAKIIRVTNVNQALAQGLEYLRDHGVSEDSRNGPVLVAPGPVVTEYTKPWERVLFSPLRDANPFFHLMEAIWMMAGGNDLAWPARFNSRFSGYSDDGRTLRGAYGFRWRKFYGMDQLPAIVAELQNNPKSRRAVLCMWSPGSDLGTVSNDIPCNTQVYFDLRGGKLNATICCRSNDILWGAYGANAVHFSILFEWIAAALKAPMGELRQMSNNYHLYTDVLPVSHTHKKDALEVEQDARTYDLYKLDGVSPSPLVIYDPWKWLAEAESFVKRTATDFSEPFFQSTAKPMLESWERREAGDRAGALEAAGRIAAEDWQFACRNWLGRRKS